MAFIGYNPEECNQLQYDITNAKNFLLSDMNELNSLVDDIEASWHGADSAQFVSEFLNVCNKTREAVSEVYEEMGRKFKRTQDEWASKQNSHVTGGRTEFPQ